MDFICIGANGFAQVGREFYYEKNKIEMKVLIDHVRSVCPVPDKFSAYAFFKVKSFPHDFGTYHEIVLMYDDYAIDSWAESVDPEKQKLSGEFWEWVWSAEAVDLESDELRKTIRDKWIESTKDETLETVMKIAV